MGTDDRPSDVAAVRKRINSNGTPSNPMHPSVLKAGPGELTLMTRAMTANIGKSSARVRLAVRRSTSLLPGVLK